MISHDVFGAQGTSPFSPRRNLLVEITRRTLTDEGLCLTCNLWQPEGFGAENFFRDSLVVPPATNLQTVQYVIWDSNSCFPPMGSKVWLLDVLDDATVTPCGSQPFQFDCHSYWMKYSGDAKNDEGTIRVFEMLAGGFGGWKGAVDFIRQHTSEALQTIAIEIDLDTAVQYACSFSTKLISLGRVPKPDDFLNTEFDLMIHGDILDSAWKLPVSVWQPSVVTISAPCPPWSGAAAAPGILRLDGELLPRAILACRFLQPDAILLEQVPGFAQHSQKEMILRCLRWIGYRIEWQKIINLADRAPVQRPRWLAFAIRVHSQARGVPFQVWKKVLPESQVHDFVLGWSDEERMALQLNEEIRRIASDPSMSKRKANPSSDRVFKQRVFRVGQVFPTFMSMYGSQHDLPPNHLQQYGYLEHFFADQEGQERFLHPAEIALLHGCSHAVYLGDECKPGWKAIGNLIAEQHALLLLVNCVNRLGSQTFDLLDLFEQHLQDCLTASTCQRLRIGRGFLLCREGSSRSVDFQDALVQLQDNLAEFGRSFFEWHTEQGLFELPEATQVTDSQSVYLCNRFQSQVTCLSQVELDEVSQSSNGHHC